MGVSAELFDEVRRVAAVVVRRWRQAGFAGFAAAVGLCALVTLVNLLDHHGGDDWLRMCCAEHDGDPLARWLVRLPGSMIAPAQNLPVWGSLVQIFVVFALAEAAVGRMRAIVVAGIGHMLSTVGARLLMWLGPHYLGGLPGVDRHVLDTGPSAATVALTAYLAVVLRCPILGTVAGVAIGLATLTHSDLAGHEHVIAWAVGLACGAMQQVVLRRSRIAVRMARETGPFATA